MSTSISAANMDLSPAMRMGISVIVRTQGNLPLEGLARILASVTDQSEVIVVGPLVHQIGCEGFPRLRLIESTAGRFEALKIGTENASLDHVLLLDEDQTMESGLIEELILKTDDAVIIPERSLNRNLVGRLMDLKRGYLEELANIRPTPDIPVIPRLYKKNILSQAFHRLPNKILRTVVQHEDSILYQEALKLGRKISMTKRRIFNIDPDLLSFLRKAYMYGWHNEEALLSGFLTREQINLIRRMDRNRIIYRKNLGPNKGIIIDLLKGAPYLAGSLSRKVQHYVRG